MKRPVLIGPSLALLLFAGAACSGGSDDVAAPTATPVVADDADDAATSDGVDDDGDLVGTRPTPTPEPQPEESFDTDREPVPEDGGADTTGPLGSTESEFETDEGSVSIGSGEVPELASGFPSPPGLEVQISSETAEDAGFSGIAPGTVTEVADFYRGALIVAGFTIVDEMQVPDDLPAGVEPTAVIFSIESDTQVGDIAITPAPGVDGSVSLIVALQLGAAAEG